LLCVTLPCILGNQSDVKKAEKWQYIPVKIDFIKVKTAQIDHECTEIRKAVFLLH